MSRIVSRRITTASYEEAVRVLAFGRFKNDPVQMVAHLYGVNVDALRRDVARVADIEQRAYDAMTRGNR